MVSVPPPTADTDIEAVKNGVKDLGCTIHSVLLYLIKVNGKADKPEKIDEDDSGDEVEETQGATGLTLSIMVLNIRRRKKEEKEIQKEENRSKCCKTNIPTKNTGIKIIPLRTIPHR